MSGLRLPLRLARREVLRRPGRTALVALLVAIPVAGMALAVTLIRSEAETPEEDWQQQNGLADAVGFEDGQPLRLPEGSRTVGYQSTYARVKAEDGQRSDASITNLPIGDPLIEGIFELVDGRPAAAPGEVVVSTALADRLDVHTGDPLPLERPDLDLEVVGEVESTTCLRCGSLLLHGDLSALEALAGPSGGGVSRSVLIDLPGELTKQERVVLQGVNAGRLSFRADALAEHRAEVDGDSAVRWSLVLGAVVLMVVAIVISAAFAVGARRQLVTIGQLSASGAPPAAIRASLVLQGTVTGLIGSAMGLLLAAVVLMTLRGTIEWHLDQRLRGYDVRPVELLAIVLIGAAAATASALVPARTAARIPTLAALAGRRPLSPVSRRLVTWGFAGIAAGLGLLFLAVLGSQGGSTGDVWAFVAIAGGALQLLGACAIAPAVVARLEPLSARLRGALRLGARSLARHRARTGAVVSAVTAAGGLAVLAGALVLGNERERGGEIQVPDDIVMATVEDFDELGQPTFDTSLPPDVEQALADVFPDASATELRGVAFDVGAGGLSGWEVTGLTPDDPFLGAQWAYIADEGALEAVRADEEVRSALRDEGAVLLSSEVGGRDVELVAPNLRQVPARVVHHPYQLGYPGNLFITEELARDLGAAVGSAGTVLQLPGPLDEDGRDAIEDVAFDTGSIEGDPEGDAYVHLAWDQETSGPSPLQLELLLTGVALLFCLFVVGVSLALAAAEGKDERDILTIAGAPPALVARSAGARAWLMATLGAAIAVPIGFLPVVVASWAAGTDPLSNGFPVVFPSRTVALLLVVVPLVVCAVAWAVSGTAQRLRPVRISTATFE